MSDYYTLLTNAGLAAVTNAALTGGSVSITHMAVGDGDGLPLQTMTVLRNEVWRGEIVRLAQSPNDNSVLECETRIPPEDGGWTVREIGLFDDNGNMIAVGNLPEGYKPVLASGSGKEMQLRMYIQNENADTITLKIDPAIIMASRSYVDDRMNEVLLSSASAHLQAADALVQLDIEKNRAETTRAKIETHAQNFRAIELRLMEISNRASRAILT